jgi:hypothetical protein
MANGIAGGNGNDQEIPSSGDPRVDAALERIRGKFKDLEDAMIVQAHLEKRMGEHMKEHAELIAEHHISIRRHQEWLRTFEMKMSEMEDKVHFLIHREMRREGGPEAQS